MSFSVAPIAIKSSRLEGFLIYRFAPNCMTLSQVFRRIGRCQNHNRNRSQPRVFPNTFQNLGAIVLRQVEIEQDQRRWFPLDGLPSRCSTIKACFPFSATSSSKSIWCSLRARSIRYTSAGLSSARKIRAADFAGAVIRFDCAPLRYGEFAICWNSRSCSKVRRRDSETTCSRPHCANLQYSSSNSRSDTSSRMLNGILGDPP